MRPTARAARATVISLVALCVLVAPVAAFDMNGGCDLALSSTDESGAPLDAASGGPSGDDGGTQDDPFLVDWEGSVSWTGSSGDQVFTNHTWQTYVFNIPIPVAGGDDNPDGTTTAEGSADVSDNAPFQFTGLYYVSGQINGEGGTHCDGSGWFKMTGNPLTTIPFWIAVGICVLGGVLLWAARPVVAVVPSTAAATVVAPPPTEPPPPPPPSGEAGR